MPSPLRRRPSPFRRRASPFRRRADRQELEESVKNVRKTLESSQSCSHLKDGDLPALSKDIRLGKRVAKGALWEILEIKSMKQGIENQESADKGRLCLKRIPASAESDSELMSKAMTDILMEMRFLKHLNHRHIVSIQAESEQLDSSIDCCFVLDNVRITLDSALAKGGKGKTSGNVMQRLQGFGRRMGGTRVGGTEWANEQRIMTLHGLADALAFVHSQNIIYRDLCPQNIGFDATGTVKLIHFGSAKEVHIRQQDNDGTYRLTNMVGTLTYMAPEVAMGYPYNEFCDCYSLAIVAWQVLTLQTPYEGYTLKDMQIKVFRGEKIRPPVKKSVSLTLCKLLHQCWATHWKRRLSMQRMRDMLRFELALVRGVASHIGQKFMRSPKGNDNEATFRLSPLRRSLQNVKVEPAITENPEEDELTQILEVKLDTDCADSTWSVLSDSSDESDDSVSCLYFL